MCGLVYGHRIGGNPVNDHIVQQYKRQRSRGTEGFGFFDGDRNHLIHEAREDKILQALKRNPSSFIMFHHRNPTSTINVNRACHPFATRDHFGDTEYVLIHNGYIWNADDLFCDHQELGIEYQSLLQDLTFNDSEALAWDFARYMEGQQEAIEARGAIALICVKLVKGKPTNLYFARNTNPLHLKRKRNAIYLSSEGSGPMIKPDTLYDFDYTTGELTTSPLVLENYRPVKTYTPASNTCGYQPQEYLPYRSGDDRWITSEDDELELLRSFNPPEPGYLPNVPKTERVPMKQPTPVKGGQWLGEVLSKKFNVLPGHDPNQLKVIEFEEGPNGQGMVPVEKTITLNASHPSSDSMWAQIEELNNAKAETLVMRYLIKHKGVFDKAYWSMEGDYVKLESGIMTPEKLDQLSEMERALDLITHNPEYEDEKSISSLWRSLWEHEQQTATR